MRESIGTNMDNYDLHPASETEGFYEHILASWDPVHEDSECLADECKTDDSSITLKCAAYRCTY